MDSTDIIPFAFEGVQVRALTIGDEPWFILNDVCAALDIQNVGNVIARLDADETSSIRLPDGTPGNPNRSVINEAGLYSVILRSDKAEAKAFKRWVTHEVLPTIRRTGSFSLAPKLPQSYADALRELAATVETNAALEAKVAEDAPKVGYVDQFVSPADVILLRNVAKAIGMQEKTLREELIRRHWIFEEIDHRWSKSKQVMETRHRYSAYANKARYFQPVSAHEAPLFKGSEVMHTLKVTPAGAEAIARSFRLQAVSA